MDIESFRNYCLEKNGVMEGFPFNETVLVFKVMGKMFALIDVETYEVIALKCDPVRAIELREQFTGISSAYHFNKKHWNGVATNGSVPDQLMYELIDHLYDLVVKGLPKKMREKLS
ncbi:MAG: MmcQ/YjbR family DNA-binding protein [Cyclobacteriaceae bacterium]|nr:MmcQ/YjbR family DNA-binding protein [Cyclobacteriaceae bacterium]